MDQTLRPIETIAYGYRCRSRLEARWLTFFKQAVIEFAYEPEGYALSSGAYLPDFFLPEYNCFFEVKSDHLDPKWRVPALYLAGDMNAGFRRPQPQYLHYPNDLSFNYVGPIKRGLGECRGDPGCDHCCSCGGVSKSDIVHEDFYAIRRCDVFFALLDSLQRYGTLVEIGYAHALGKDVCIGACNYKTGADDPLWFARAHGHQFEGKTRKDLLNGFFRWFRVNYPRPRIFQKPVELYCSSKQTCVVAFGDPLEHQLYVFGEYPHALRTKIDCSIEAREFARQARFEHGETPMRLPGPVRPKWAVEED
jgi:hypothetical protein